MVPTAAPSWVQAGPEATPCTGEETWLTQHPQPGTGPGASAASQASPFHLHCRHLSWLRPLPAGQAGPEDSREEQGSPVDAHERALNPVPASRAHILHPHPNLLLHPETHWVPEDAACYLQTPTFAQGHLPAAALACARIPGNQVLPSGPAPACPAPPPPQPGTQPRCLGSTDVRPRARLTEGICGGPALTLHQPQPFAGRRAQGHWRSQKKGCWASRCPGVGVCSQGF